MKDVRPEHNRLLNDIYRKPVKLSKPAMFHNYVRMISQSRICVSFKKIRVVCGKFNVFFQPEMPNWLRLKWLKIINLKKILLGKRHTLQHTMINGYTGALTPHWAKKQTKGKNLKKIAFGLRQSFLNFFLPVSVTCFLWWLWPEPDALEINNTDNHTDRYTRPY